MSIPSVFGLKGMVIAAAIGAAAASYATYRVTNAFGEARALRLERDTLTATISDRDETIARNARLTTGVNDIAISVNRAIAYLREAASDEALTRDDPACRYSDDEFGRVQSRIDRAAKPGAGLPATARP
jgi:hypothetical protein